MHDSFLRILKQSFNFCMRLRIDNGFRSRGGWTRVIYRHKTCDILYILSLAMASSSVFSPCSMPGVFVDYRWFSQKEDESWIILSVGQPFMYNIPNFEIMAIELRHIKVEVTNNGPEACFDAFIRCDTGLCRSYPSTLSPKSVFAVQVLGTQYHVHGAQCTYV